MARSISASDCARLASAVSPEAVCAAIGPRTWTRRSSMSAPRVAWAINKSVVFPARSIRAMTRAATRRHETAAPRPASPKARVQLAPSTAAVIHPPGTPTRRPSARARGQAPRGLPAPARPHPSQGPKPPATRPPRGLHRGPAGTSRASARAGTLARVPQATDHPPRRCQWGFLTCLRFSSGKWLEKWSSGSRIFQQWPRGQWQEVDSISRDSAQGLRAPEGSASRVPAPKVSAPGTLNHFRFRAARLRLRSPRRRVRTVKGGGPRLTADPPPGVVLLGRFAYLDPNFKTTPTHPTIRRDFDRAVTTESMTSGQNPHCNSATESCAVLFGDPVGRNALFLHH